jgi:5,6,7,8-tetrahydromethanopterin hydro-lyase
MFRYEKMDSVHSMQSMQSHKWLTCLTLCLLALASMFMVSKVTVTSTSYTNILMGTVQAAIANGVLDAVRLGDIPKSKVNDLGIIVSVWLDPAVLTEKPDFSVLFETHRAATAKAIAKAMNHEPGIDWLLKNQANITHCFHQMALDSQGG